MDMPIGEEPPKSTDLDGWRKAIAANRLSVFRLEALAAAFQDLGGLDADVRNALAKHLSDAITHMLRKLVGFNHPNEGWDIILRTHESIFAGLLNPQSADGRGLRARSSGRGAGGARDQAPRRFTEDTGAFTQRNAHPCGCGYR
jgi:hypothetical protein